MQFSRHNVNRRCLHQGHYYVDCTMNHVETESGNTILEKPKFAIKTSTIPLVEKPDCSSGYYLRAVIDNKLRLNYVVDFNSMQKVLLL